MAFGDGSTSSGSPIAKHVYNSGVKDYTAEATVTDVLGRTHHVNQTVRVISLRDSKDIGEATGLNT